MQTDDVPADMMDRRAQVVNNLRNLQKAVDPIINCLSNPAVIRNFRQDRSFNIQYLQVGWTDRAWLMPWAHAGSCDLCSHTSIDGLYT